MTFPIAQSALGFLFYLLIGVFWLVGNLLQQREAKRKAEALRKRREEREREERRTGKKQPDPDQPKPRTLEDDLETFLGRLGGEEPKRREPVRREPPAPPPRDKPKVTPPPLRPPAAFDPIPASAGSTPPVKETEIKVGEEMKKKSRIRDLDMSDSFKEMAEMKELEEVVGDLMEQGVRHEALENVRSMMIDMSRTLMATPTMPIQSMRPETTRTSRPELRRKENLKRALVNTVILDQPKGLQEQPFKERP